MKKIFYLALIAFATIFTACEKDKDSSSETKSCYKVQIQYYDGSYDEEWWYMTSKAVEDRKQEILQYNSHIVGIYEQKVSDSNCK